MHSGTSFAFSMGKEFAVFGEFFFFFYFQSRSLISNFSSKSLIGRAQSSIKETESFTKLTFATMTETHLHVNVRIVQNLKLLPPRN